MTLIKDERKAVHNKQIGNRAGEMLLLSFCPRLNGSNSIQHLCLKSTPSPICKPLALTLKTDTTDNKRTEKCQRFAKLKELFSQPKADPKQHI